MSENSILNFSVNLPNKLNIKNILEVHNILSANISSRKSLIIHIPDDSDVDLSFVQLIESARIRAKSSGVGFNLAEAANGRLRDVLDRSGFAAGFSEEDEKFWFHGKARQ